MIDLLNRAGTEAFSAAQSMLLQAAALVVALLLVELLFGRRLRSALRYAFWLLVVVKLLLPPSLLLPTGAGFWLGRWFAEPVVANPPAPPQVLVQEVPLTLSMHPSENQPVPKPAAVVTTLGWAGKLLLLWVAGAMALGIGMTWRNRPVRRLVAGSTPASPELEALLATTAAELQLRRLPRLRLSDANHSPALCGFFNPLILLPQDLAARLSESGLRAVLLHELAHLRRRDLWVNLLQTGVQVLWWWNPFVWLANARIRTLREQAVDECVMLATREDGSAYPATLVEVARHCAARPMLALSFLGIFESRRALRTRVDRLLNHPLPHRATLGWSGWLMVLLTALVALPMAFTRRVEAATTAVPPAVEDPAPTSANDAPAGYGLSSELRARYGLGRASTTGANDNNNGNTNVNDTQSSAENLDPTLARRYGLGAGQAARYGMDPTLARRYGLDPKMAARYGLNRQVQETNIPRRAPIVTLAVPADDTGWDLDGVVLSPGQLQAELTKLVSREPDLMVLLKPHREASAAQVTAAIQTAKAAGVTVVTSVSEEPSPGAGFASSPPSTVLMTRQFRVSPNTFIQGLESVTGRKLEARQQGGAAMEVQPLVRDFFRAAGVDFPAVPPADGNAQSRKALFFNDRTGILFVRATESDLDIIEKAVQALNVTPPQVEIEVKFVEFTEAGVEDRILGKSVPTTGILTESQSREIQRSLETRQGVRLVSAPKVTTLSGRQTRISLTDNQALFDPTTGALQDVPFGRTLDVVPFVTADDHSIQLTVQATVANLLGQDDSSPAKRPRVQTTELKSEAVIWDGQTMVLVSDFVEGPVVGNLPNRVPAPGDIQSESAGTEAGARKRLLVLITPNIVDPAGNRVNDPTAQPFNPNSVPSQPKR